MFQQLPTRWISVLMFFFALATWTACSKEYSLENAQKEVTDNGPVNGDTSNTGGSDTTTNPGGGDTTTPGGGGNDTAISTNTDADFLKSATIINRAQVNNSTLAVDRGAVQPVRDFAQAVLNRFTQAQTDIEVVATALSVSIPGKTDAAHETITEGFLDMEGRTFDIGYIDYQLLELQRAIDLYRAQINNGDNPQAKAYASKYLPYLQEFLQTASAIRQNL